VEEALAAGLARSSRALAGGLDASAHKTTLYHLCPPSPLQLFVNSEEARPGQSQKRGGRASLAARRTIRG
jgi:hypothetical protein